MHVHKYLIIAAAVVTAIAATTAGALGATGTADTRARHERKADELHIGLTPSSPQLAACMPGAGLNAVVKLTTDERGSDQLEIEARHLPPNREFTIFLLQQAGAPFGAAEYVGDFSTNAAGDSHTRLNLIVQEAFSSTIVNGTRTRVDLNRIGVWFADPAADDFCLGAGSPVTPFDGDNAAGVQAFNSANADPLPAP